MKKSTLLIILFLFSNLIFSQIIEFKGVVLEKGTASFIENAIVTIEETNFITKTNINGKFVIYKQIPLGEQIVSVAKKNYETKYLIINVLKNQSININKIELSLTTKAKRLQEKQKKELDKKIKKLKKEKKKEEKKKRKQQEAQIKKLKKKKGKIKNKLLNDDDVVITYSTTDNESSTSVFSEIQLKYSKLLSVPVEELSNTKLYDFIDDWMGTPYLLGGESKKSIDCSSFSQRLFMDVYGVYIERTAEKQFKSKALDKFKNMNSLEEGDLVFFKHVDKDGNTYIGHVGVYLKNYYFINATSKQGKNGIRGVHLSNLKDAYWKRIFVAGGRRTDINK